MKAALENGKELSHSLKANEVNERNEWMFILSQENLDNKKCIHYTK
jgi:hypothetical protein